MKCFLILTLGLMMSTVSACSGGNDDSSDADTDSDTDTDTDSDTDTDTDTDSDTDTDTDGDGQIVNIWGAFSYGDPDIDSDSDSDSDGEDTGSFDALDDVDGDVLGDSDPDTDTDTAPSDKPYYFFIEIDEDNYMWEFDYSDSGNHSVYMYYYAVDSWSAEHDIADPNLCTLGGFGIYGAKYNMWLVIFPPDSDEYIEVEAGYYAPETNLTFDLYDISDPYKGTFSGTAMVTHHSN